MRLSDRIEAAVQRHAEQYPGGDWRAVNDELGRLWYEAQPILCAAGVSPYKGGNEGRISALRALSQ